MNIDRCVQLFRILFSKDAIEREEIIHLLDDVKQNLIVKELEIISSLHVKDVNVKFGNAVNTQLAAHCFNDSIRTYAFMKGLLQIIEAKLQNDNVKINILYAGTGPMMTLILPCLFLLSSESVQFTTIEVNEESYELSINFILKLGKQSFFKNYYNQDALQFHTEDRYDIIISETMDKALSREPQVAIFSHLVQFLKPEGKLIPQSIVVDAVATSVALEMKVDYDCHTDVVTRIENRKHRKFITNLVHANREFYEAHNLKKEAKIHLKEFKLPDLDSKYTELYFITTVVVADGIVLEEDDSWLTKQYIGYPLLENSFNKPLHAYYINEHSPYIKVVHERFNL